ncbi:MAG: hydantoinase B/oxoprolinase family protein [Pseudomonadota bacterium]
MNSLSDRRIEPYLMSLLASRIGNISIRMSDAMIKASRSAVMAMARDCSTAICDGQGEVLAFPAGFPVHVGCGSLAGRMLLEMHGDDLRPGDAYLLNSPYHGNTHAADHTIMVPVFYEDELMFIGLCRGHQADIGNSVPTTYHAKAKDVYEEGALIFPCVRVQRDYKDVKDIINMCRLRIRVPDVWYGDYLAQIGAARICERELIQLIKKYGRDTIKAFCEQYHEYGRQRMIEEIRKFPAGTASHVTIHDHLPGLIDEGIKVKATVTVDPDNGFITVDYTDNADSLPCGLNICEGTLTSAARTAILNRMSVSVLDFPCCEGALGRIIVKMREGSVVGKARHPYSSSVATTNVNDRAVVAAQYALNHITELRAGAECHMEQGVSVSVISGRDSRYGGKPFVTQIISGISGGPGINGHDGYLWDMVSNAGMPTLNSVEMVERAYPIMFLQQQFMPDQIGSGKWDGGPAVIVDFRTLDDPVTFIYVADGHYNPALGAAGGRDGVSGQALLGKYTNGIDVEITEELPTFHTVTLEPGQAIRGIYASSGGYGDPLERDPELVRHRVREGWISEEYAREVYGVALDTGPELYAVDYQGTERLRQELRAKSRA